MVNGDFSTDPSRRHLIMDDTTIKVISNLTHLYASLLKYALANKDRDMVDALMPYFDWKLIQLMKQSFEKEFATKIKDAFGKELSNVKLAPSWLNAEDFSKIMETSNMSYIAPECSDVTGLSDLLKYLGNKPEDVAMVFDEVHDGMEAAMHGAAVLRRTAEVLPRRPFVVARHVYGMAHHLIDAFVLHGADGDDGNAEQPLHLVDADGPAVALHLVHHVERQHHRDAELHQLHGEVEVALDVCGIHDVDDAARLALQDELTADDLLARVWAEAVDAGEVGDGGIGVSLDDAVLAVDCHAGDVADMLFAARQLIEKRGLSAVLIAYERKGERPLFCR